MKKASFCSMMTRALALLLLCALLPLSLFACGSSDTVDAEKVVGEVDGVKIRYDELYFLIKSYRDSIAAKHEGNPEDLAKALDELAREELIANAAILLLCEERGLEYKEKDLEDAVNAEIESILSSDFGGDEEAYFASLEEHGLTERYLRYTLGLDTLYDRLMTVYPKEGLVATDEAELKAYIMENFIHVYHIALFNDSMTEEEDAANFQKLTEARKKLAAGSVTMYDLIHGSRGEGENKILLKGYNEDISDMGNGHYLTRGTWDKAYEEAAFSLDVNEISQVVKVTNTSRSVPAYYLIQRFSMDEDYVEKNLSDLQDEYYAGVIYSDLQETREGLSFEPNEFYESLDLANLLPPSEEGGNALVVVLCIVGGVAIVGGIAAAVIVKKKKK